MILRFWRERDRCNTCCARKGDRKRERERERGGGGNTEVFLRVAVVVREVVEPVVDTVSVACVVVDSG